MLQLICHLLGDYVLQSDWMANEKTKKSLPALLHALLYTLPFLLVTFSWKAQLVICGTHFLIDRFRLIRYLNWAKNFMAPRMTVKRWREEVVGPGGAVLYKDCEGVEAVWWHPWAECAGTGYHKERPPWLAVWLMIIADNTLHLAINALAIAYL